jgi:hypothetical protein
MKEGHGKLTAKGSQPLSHEENPGVVSFEACMVPWICRAGPFQLHKQTVVNPAAAFCACIRTLVQ